MWVCIKAHRVTTYESVSHRVKGGCHQIDVGEPLLRVEKIKIIIFCIDLNAT